MLSIWMKYMISRIQNRQKIRKGMSKNICRRQTDYPMEKPTNDEREINLALHIGPVVLLMKVQSGRLQIPERKKGLFQKNRHLFGLIHVIFIYIFFCVHFGS